MKKTENGDGVNDRSTQPAVWNPEPLLAEADRIASDSTFRLPNSHFQIPPSEPRIPNSAFRILFYYWLPLLAYCLLIFIQSSHPAPESLPAVPLMDKWLHLVGYALLGVLCDRAFRRQWPRVSPQRLFWAAVIATALYGASDELHQYFVPFRNADPLDVAADALGGLLGVGAFRGVSAWAARRAAAAS